MKAKPSMWFVSSAVVAGLLIAGAAVLLVTSVQRVSRVEQQLKAKRQQLTGLYLANPFPSPENVQRENEAAAKLRKWYVALVDRARQGQMQLEERSPSTFMALLGQTQRDLMASAKVGGRLPPNFGFGFERYFGEGSKLPSPEHVPRLTQQLKIVEALCAIFLEENVTKVHAVRRELFEGDAAPAAPAAAEGAAMEGVALVSTNAGIMAEGALYSRFHFTLELETRESAVLGILNRLAKHDLFIVVTGLHFTKQGDDLLPVSREKPKPSATPEAGAAPLLEAPLTREQRIVCGVAVEKPMRVIIDLDVYNFRGGDA